MKKTKKCVRVRIVNLMQQQLVLDKPEPPRCWKCDCEVELPVSAPPYYRCWHCGALLITKKVPHEPVSPHAPNP